MDEERTKSYRLKFVGARFEGARLPVGVLPDIEAFRDILVSFAKANWLEQHPGRQRVPSGFDTQLGLDLVLIEDGSAVPVLQLSVNEAQAGLPGLPEGREVMVTAAYDRFSALIEKAASDPNFRPTLRRDQISAFNRFGAGLKDNEHIDLVSYNSGSGKVVSLDTHRRRDLITRISETYERRFEGTGQLSATSIDGKITVDIEGYGAVSIDVGRARVLDEFDGSLLAAVSLDVTLKLDAHDRVLDVEQVHAAEIEEAPSERPKVVTERSLARLQEIAAYERGWLDGEGERVTSAAKSSAEGLLRSGADWFASSGIFPTPDGGVQIETAREKIEITIVINADGTIYGFVLGKDASNEEISEDLTDQSAVYSAMIKYLASEDSIFG